MGSTIRTFFPHALPFWLGLAALMALPTTLPAQQPIDPALAEADPDPDRDVLWYDAQHLRLEGQGWDDVKHDYDRLPARAEDLVRRRVWQLSRQSAGLAVRFVTDATTIHARWTLTSDRLALPHMPATGVSGVDLYMRSPEGRWEWVDNGRPKEVTNTARLIRDLPDGRREYMLYLPLYNGVASLEVGIPQGRTIAPAPPRPDHARKPLVFYGTSVTQGACASRPGMAHTAIVGRRLDRPVINLGFSGNGKLEQEIATLMTEIDAEVYIVNCLPNSSLSEVTERVAPLVRTLRKARPDTPILLVESRFHRHAFLAPDARRNVELKNTALRDRYEQLKAEGVKHLHYLNVETLQGDDRGIGTVDGSHPTDLGFVQYADGFTAALEPILTPDRSSSTDENGSPKVH